MMLSPCFTKPTSPFRPAVAILDTLLVLQANQICSEKKYKFFNVLVTQVTREKEAKI